MALILPYKHHVFSLIYGNHYHRLIPETLSENSKQKLISLRGQRQAAGESAQRRISPFVQFLLPCLSFTVDGFHHQLPHGYIVHCLPIDSVLFHNFLGYEPKPPLVFQCSSAGKSSPVLHRTKSSAAIRKHVATEIPASSQRQDANKRHAAFMAPHALVHVTVECLRGVKDAPRGGWSLFPKGKFEFLSMFLQSLLLNLPFIPIYCLSVSDVKRCTCVS